MFFFKWCWPGLGYSHWILLALRLIPYYLKLYPIYQCLSLCYVFEAKFLHHTELTIMCLLLFLHRGCQQCVQVAVSRQCEAAGFSSLGCHGDQPLHRHWQRDVPLRRKSVNRSSHHWTASEARLCKDGILCIGELREKSTRSINQYGKPQFFKKATKTVFCSKYPLCYWEYLVYS